MYSIVVTRDTSDRLRPEAARESALFVTRAEETAAQRRSTRVLMTYRARLVDYLHTCESLLLES